MSPPSSTRAPRSAVDPATLHPRGGVETGYGVYDLANGEGLDHGGRHLRLEAGVEAPIESHFFLQGNGFFTANHSNRDLGAGAVSSFDSHLMGLHARFGVRLFDDFFRASLGVDVGAAHLNAPFEASGERAGALFTRNAQLYPLDQWGVLFGGEICVAGLHGVLNFCGRVGLASGLNPNPERITSPRDTASLGLNIPLLQFGGSLDVGNLLDILLGHWRH